MSRHLIVANQTLGGHRLIDEVRQRVEEGDCQLYVLVPATGADEEPGTRSGTVASGTPSSLPMGAPDAGRGATGEDPHRRAFNRLKDAIGRFEDLGATDVRGEVGDPDPLEAVDQTVESKGPFDEIIVSTLPAGASRWLRMDLASKISRRYDVPVTHVEAEPSGDAE